MLALLWLCVGTLTGLFCSRRTLLKNLALRQQLAVFKRRHHRPILTATDKAFWVALRRFWPSWKKALIVVKPETVVRCTAASFRLYWRLTSRMRKPGRSKACTKQIRELIFQMMAENPTWSAPRIHGELLMLGFEVSERSVSRWMRRAPRSPEAAQRWLNLLRNHREAIAAMDFFSVPTITCNVLYCFFILGHDRRRILHFNVTSHPTSAWIVQQMREAFRFQPSVKFLVLNHDAKYGTEVPAVVRSMNMTAVRTTVGCPWQNGIAERFVGSCRGKLLDHVIAINESHLKRPLAGYVRYYHADRTHCGLGKQTPEERRRCSGRGKVVSWPRVGGLHHRYQRVA